MLEFTVYYLFLKLKMAQNVGTGQEITSSNFFLIIYFWPELKITEISRHSV